MKGVVVMKKVILCSTAFIFLLGCDNATSPTDPYEGMDTPEDTLVKFETTFVETNKDKSKGKEFMSLFSGDFVFYFDKDDVGVSWPGYEIPEYWELDDFSMSISSIFYNSPKFQVNVSEGSIGDVPEGATDFETPKIMFDGLIWLDEQSATGPHGPVTFTFTKIDTEYGPRWIITEWRDFTCDYSSEGGRRPWTLGESLAYFYGIYEGPY
jgi:hypothetical protein